MSELGWPYILSSIKNFVFDVDGVFTDGRLLITDSGEFHRVMNVRDGYACKRAKDAGYGLFIITGGSSIGVKERFLKLGADEVHLRIHDKLPVMTSIAERHGIDMSSILYAGDDLPDVPCIIEAGVGVAPSDAVQEAQNASDFVCPHLGGDSFVRYVIEQVMRIQNTW